MWRTSVSQLLLHRVTQTVGSGSPRGATIDSTDGCVLQDSPYYYKLNFTSRYYLPYVCPVAFRIVEKWSRQAIIVDGEL
jgi:hypothetical protein